MLFFGYLVFVCEFCYLFIFIFLSKRTSSPLFLCFKHVQVFPLLQIHKLVMRIKFTPLGPLLSSFKPAENGALHNEKHGKVTTSDHSEMARGWVFILTCQAWPGRSNLLNSHLPTFSSLPTFTSHDIHKSQSIHTFY